MPFCGRCPHPTSGIEREISGNNTNAEGIDREREWVSLQELLHSCFSFLLQKISKPFSMIVVCVMIAGRETQNNGILKMLALPVSRYALSLAKFCVLMFYLLMEMVVFLIVFVIAGLIATNTMGITETLPIFYLLKWCIGLFLTMLPSVATMWALTVLFEKPLLSVGLNLLLVIPGVLVANTPLWIAYPYCYSGYLVSCSLHDFTAETSNAAFSLMPFLPCAVLVFVLVLALAITRFGKKEMR